MFLKWEGDQRKGEEGDAKEISAVLCTCFNSTKGIQTLYTANMY